MKIADNTTVSIGYAYPSSTIANKAGFGSAGTFYVAIMVKDKENILCYHETKELSKEYADRLEMPYYEYSH